MLKRSFAGLTAGVILCLSGHAQLPVIQSASAVFCSGAYYSFTLANGPVVKAYSWEVSPPGMADILSQPDATALVCSFPVSGVYTIRLRYTDTLNEQVLITRRVQVYTTAQAKFSASLTTAGYPAELILTNYSTGSVRNYWLFDNGASGRDSSANTTHAVNSSGAHDVKLIVIGKNGCNDTTSYAYYISDSSGVILPNVFTPNEDGINDVYKPIARGMISMHVWIFNRDGVLVSEWDKTGGVWDGRTTSGEKCTDGQYFVVAEAKGFDGRTYKLKRALTLLR